MAETQLPYREAGAHAGLPFPRKGMTAYIVATAFAALCGALFPLGLIGHSPAGVVQTLKEGGGSMWLLLMLVPIVPLLIAILSAMAIRGRKVPPIAIVGSALFPALVAFAGTIANTARTASALHGVPIEPALRMRIAFEGTQEGLSPLQFGGAICAFALGAAAVGCAGIAASVDRTRVGAPAASTWMMSVTTPVVGLFASVVVMFVTRSLGTSLYAFGLSLVSMVIVAIVAPLTALVSPAFRDWHDTSEQRRMLGAIICSAACAALALWLLDRVAILGTERVVLGACSGDSVDPSQRARILMEGRFETRAFVILSALHVPSALFAFAPAVLRGRTKGVCPLDLSGALALALPLMIGIGFYAVEAHAVGGIASIAKTIVPAALPADLPAVKDATMLRPVRDPITTFGPDGRMQGPQGSSPLADRTFAVGKYTGISQLLSTMPRMVSGYSQPRMSIVVRDDSPPEIALTTVDPDIRAMMTTEPAAISMHVDDGGPLTPSVTFTNVSSVIVRTGGKSTTVAFGPDFETELRTALGSMYGDSAMTIHVRDSTNVDDLVRVIASTGARRPFEVYVQRARTP